MGYQRRGKVSSDKQLAEYKALSQKPGKPARKADTSKLAGAAKKISAVYEFPYLAHAPMEPLNCVVDLRKDGCTVWAGSQFQTVDQGAIAATAGLKPEQVVLNTMMAGGGFGRRAVPTRTIWWKRSTSPRSGRRPARRSRSK
jgi:isoquinoline 1-oxidoreductase beta subunit